MTTAHAELCAELADDLARCVEDGILDPWGYLCSQWRAGCPTYRGTRVSATQRIAQIDRRRRQWREATARRTERLREAVS